jgi:hypothetical protein
MGSSSNGGHPHNANAVHLAEAAASPSPRCEAGGKEPPRFLSDPLGPGGSFRVLLPFLLPETAKPAGLAVHHGDFPGVAIIGADQSFLHTPALLRFASVRQP